MADVRELFDRGIVKELVDIGYLPPTWISEEQIPGYIANYSGSPALPEFT